MPKRKERGLKKKKGAKAMKKGKGKRIKKIKAKGRHKIVETASTTSESSDVVLSEAFVTKSVSTTEMKRDIKMDNSYINKRLKEVIEEPFYMTEVQFVGVVEHYNRVLDKIAGNTMSIELSNLLQKFKSCYSGQLVFRNKVRELTSELEIKDKDKNELLVSLKKKGEDKNILHTELTNARKALAEVKDQKNLHAIQLQKWTAERNAMQSRIDELQSAKAKVTVPESRTDLNSFYNTTQLALVTKQLAQSETEKGSAINELSKANKKLKSNQRELIEFKSGLMRETHRRKRMEAELRECKRAVHEPSPIFRSELNRTKQSLKLSREKCAEYEQEKERLQDERSILSSKVEELGMLLAHETAKLDETMSEKNKISKKLETVTRSLERTKEYFSILKEQAEKEALQFSEVKDQMRDDQILIENFRLEREGLLSESEEIQKLQLEAEEEIKTLVSAKNTLDIKLFEKEDVIKNLTRTIELKDEVIKTLKSQLSATEPAINNLERQVGSLNELILKMRRKLDSLTSTVKSQKSKQEQSEFQIGRLKIHISELHQLIANEKELRNKLQERLAESKMANDKSLDDFKIKMNEVASLKRIISGFKDKCLNDESQMHEKFQRQQIEFNRMTKEAFGLNRDLHIQMKVVAELKLKMSEEKNASMLLAKDLKKTRDDLSNVTKNLEKANGEIKLLQTRINQKVKAIELLMEKQSLQDAAMDRGHKEYDSRVRDISLLKSQLKILSSRNGFLKDKLIDHEQLRGELIRTHNELAQEKIRSHVLESEVQHPSNVHRWRILEGTDPDKVQLIEKCSCLQKSVLNLMAKVERKDAELEQTKSLVDLMKTKLERRQVEDDLLLKLKDYQSRLKKQKEVSQTMEAEINMYKSFCSSYKSENDELKQSMREMRLHKRTGAQSN